MNSAAPRALRVGFWLLLLVVAAASLLPAPDLPAAGRVWSDKLLHAVAHGGLALAGMIAHPRRRTLAAGGVFAAGIGIELLQAPAPTREASLADVVANGLGVAAAWLTLRLASRRRPRP